MSRDLALLLATRCLRAGAFGSSAVVIGVHLEAMGFPAVLAQALAAGLTGMPGLASLDLGPFAVVEQALLAEAATGRGRNRAFARYSLGGALAAAAGGLVAGAARGHLQQLFFGYAALGALTALLPFWLSPSVEPAPGSRPAGDPRPLVGLAALFTLDALGGVGPYGEPLSDYRSWSVVASRSVTTWPCSPVSGAGAGSTRAEP